jgi:hypothetical protein
MNCRQLIGAFSSTDHRTRFGRDAHFDIFTLLYPDSRGAPV